MKRYGYNYYQQILKPHTLPYAVLHIELLHNNIETNLQRAGDKKIRLASKSIRCIEVMHLLLNYKSNIQGVMTYHGAEMLYLAEQGFDDLLMGYPVVNKHLLKAIGAQIKKGKTLCLMVDSIEHLDLLNAIGKEENVVFPVCVDIDLSDNFPFIRFGVFRSNIESNKSLEAFLKHLNKLNNVKLDGLMGYEAQIAGVTDKGVDIRNSIIRRMKKSSIKCIKKRRQEAVEMIETAGHKLRFVNGGGTGSLESTQAEQSVTEVTIGSGFYNPHLFDNYVNFNLEPAMFYGIEITRKPNAETYTCHSGGYIASGCIEKIKAPIIHLPTSGYFDEREGAGEVQTPVRFKNLQENINIGDPIFLRHAKSGELLERFNKVLFLENNKLREVPTYRGEGQSFC